MGQKTHPIGFRIGTTKDWTSKWYADKRDYTKLLHQDIKIKEYIKIALASMFSPHFFLATFEDFSGWPLKVLVGANSPNLCPTISEVI